MAVASIREFIRAVPFKPYEIITRDDRYEIVDRFQVAIGEKYVIALMSKSGITTIPQSQIVSVKVLEHST